VARIWYPGRAKAQNHNEDAHQNVLADASDMTEQDVIMGGKEGLKMKDQAATVEALRDRITRDIHTALGLSDAKWSYRPLKLILRAPLHRFAQLGTLFDKWVDQLGFAEAARQALSEYVGNYSTCGVEHVPAQGPLLITANHPGAFDSLLIAASAGRDDLKILVGDIGFLRGLPSIKKHVVFRTQDLHARVGALRSAIRHLEAGGALLIFPSGRLEPDPEVLPGGQDALCEWSPSVELMLRRVPEAQVLVTIVSGVLAAACVRNPLPRLWKKATLRLGVAEGLQIIQQILFDRQFALSPRVSFAEPVTFEQLHREIGLPGATEALIERAQSLLAHHTVSGPSTLR
jgi:hypothetical protein